MADNLEQLVETYLTINRGTFVSPQYLVGKPNVWESHLDFLAISFSENIVWMVEVTSSPSSKLYDKINTFNTEYKPRIQGQLEEHKVVRDWGNAGWDIGFWIFVPKSQKIVVENRLESASVLRNEVTPLEETLFPTWEKRFI
jgi:hypothetical protein